MVNKITVVGASNSSGVSSLSISAETLASSFLTGGLTTGVFGKSFEWNGVTVPSFGVMLKALETSHKEDAVPVHLMHPTTGRLPQILSEMTASTDEAVKGWLTL